jgi:glyoxylase-like metal-dependent hydrolase (beta-lactamase superfamily II)
MGAPLLGNSSALINRFKLGAFEVTTIADGSVVRPSVAASFGLGRPADEIAALARDNFVPHDSVESSYTPTLVNTGRQLILFDAGNDHGRKSNGAGFFAERLPLAGYRPEDIDIVAFTHGHPDHIAGIHDGAGLVYPNARYVIGRREYDEWIKGDNIPERRADSRALFLRLMPPIAEKTTFLEPGDDVVTGIRAVESHGHSIGHLAYQVESEGHGLMIWGDLTNHYVFSLQRPEWHMSLDDDRDQAAATRARILDMLATERLPAAGFHMPFPAVGYIERHASSYRWVPATYQFRV